MSIQKLSSLNAQHIASLKQNTAQNRNTETASNTSPKVSQAPKINNKFAIAGIVFASGAALISTIALINGKKTSGNVETLSKKTEELMSLINQLFTKAEDITKNLADNTASGAKGISAFEKLNTFAAELQEKLDGFATEFKGSTKAETENKNAVEKLNNTISQLQEKIRTMQQTLDSKSEDDSSQKIIERLKEVQETLTQYINKSSATGSAEKITPHGAEKKAEEAAQDIIETIKDAVSFKEVDIKNGIATLKNSDKKFSGTITDTLKDGRAVKWQYKDGVIQEALTGDTKKTYLRPKNPYGKASIVTIEDSSPITTVIKKVEQDGKTTIKEFKKAEIDNDRLKFQTKHFEIEENNNYIRTSLKSKDDRLNPKIYLGSTSDSKEHLAAADELQGLYEYAAIEDDGYRTFKLFLEKPQPKKPQAEKPLNLQKHVDEKKDYRVGKEIFEQIDKILNPPQD